MYRDDEKEDTTIYKVVVNHEEQYSIWPADRENPLGWKDVGKSGPKAECLAHIGEVWTDMRPLSLRKKMEEDAKKPERGSRPQSTNGEASQEKPEERVSLVQRLSQGEHPVEASLRPERTTEALKDCIDRGYVHIKFTNTQGRTELGVRLDQAATDLSQADFEKKIGSVHLVGSLTLDYVKARCIADIDLATLDGKGHLELLKA